MRPAPARHAGVLLLVAISLTGCRREPAPVEDSGGEATSVTVETARQQTLRATVRGRGTVVAAASGDWTIYPAQMGRIAELPKREGDAVETGDVLVRFEYGNTSADLSAYQLELTNAEGRLQTARQQHDRVKAMFDRGYASRNELEAAVAAVTAAELEVTRAKAQLQSTTEAAERAIVRARFPGVVAKVFHRDGEMVNASMLDPVLRVIDPTHLEVAVPVPVQELTQVEIGQPATIVSANGAEPGTVLLRPLPDDPRATTQDVRIGFMTPTTLPIDSPVEVEILIAERPDVVALPAEAVLEAGGAPYVMVAGPDGQAHRREIRVGFRGRDRVEIAAGIAPGERVIVKDAAAIAEGTPVEAR